MGMVAAMEEAMRLTGGDEAAAIRLLKAAIQLVAEQKGGK